VLASSSAVRAQGVTIAVAAGACGVAVVSVVLGALAVISALFDGHYRRVLEMAGGIRNAMRPYLVVSAVAGCTTVAAIVTALGWPIFGMWGQLLSLAFTVFLTGWCVFGMVSLVELTIFHAESRAKLMRGIEDAKAIRTSRLTAVQRD
jgi:hypothetical protein